MSVVSSFNGTTRRIYLAQGVTTYHPIDDIYKEYRVARRTDESLRKFAPMIRAEGSVPKGGGKKTSRYLVLLDGTKIIPYDENISLYQTGDIITDDPDNDPSIYDTSGITSPLKVYITPSESEVILVPYRDAIEVQLSFAGKVYIDVANGTAGVDYPTGTIGQPSNNLMDAATIAAVHNIKTFDFKGQLLLQQPFVGYSFNGIGSLLSDVIVCFGVDVSYSKFNKATVVGAVSGNYHQFETCYIDALQGMSGLLLESAINGAVSVGNPVNGAFLIVRDLSPVVGAIIDIAGANKIIQIATNGGSLTLTGAGAGTVSQCRINDEGTITVDDGNLAGSVFTVEGIGKLVNTSTLAVVTSTLQSISNNLTTKTYIALAPKHEHILEESMFTLYKATTPCGRYYIGVTNNLKRRIKEHGSSKYPFGCALRKYGKANVVFETLTTLETAELAYELEGLIVDEAFVKSRETYNVSAGGRAPIGLSNPMHNPAIIAKHSNIWSKENNPMNDPLIRAKNMESQCKKIIIVDNKEYAGMNIAARALGVSRQLLRHRALSDNYPNTFIKE